MTKRRKRFFYHYRKSTGGMTVHFDGQCIPCVDVVCKVETETHRNKTQPHLVIRGFATSVTLDGHIATIHP